MISKDEQIIRAWAERLSAAPVLSAARGEGEADGLLAEFCVQLKALAPDILIRTGPDESFRRPALIIGRHSNIAYQAVPAGRELEPFLEALKSSTAPIEGAEPPPAPSRIELPAELTLYISGHCPHCPQAVRKMTALAAAEPQLRLAVIDGSLFEKEAKEAGIRSVPTLILDRNLRWVGRIDVQEVIDQCIRRDPTHLSAGSLRRMLEAGEAARAAALMIERDRIIPSLLELLVHERWSVRLGAMVTMEYLADQAPQLASQAVEPLWNRFGALSEPVQGDAVHVLGLIGSKAALDRLRQIAAGGFAESVRQAAEEELEP